MWLSQHQTVLTELVQSTLVRLCTDHVPFDGRLELDGLICISSDVSGARQIVVKIHKVIGPKSTPVDEERVAVKTAVPKTAAFHDQFCTPPAIAMEVVETPPVNGIQKPSVTVSTRAAADTPARDVSHSRETYVSRSTEGHLQAWKQRAPQILKLLTKSESSLNRSQTMQSLEPTDLSKTAPTRVKSSKVSPTTHATDAVREDRVEDLTISASHSGTNRWRCKICHVQCANFSELELHMRSEHVRFVCRLCLNSFTLSCNLRRHMKLHAGVRPHTCVQCGSTFSRSTDLKIHMKKHSTLGSKGEKCGSDTSLLSSSSELSVNSMVSGKSTILHECNICNKGFAIASHLAEHRRMHGVKPDKLEEMGTSKSDISSTDGKKNQVDILSQGFVNGSVEIMPGADDAVDCSMDLSKKYPTSMAYVDAVKAFAPLFVLATPTAGLVEALATGAKCVIPVDVESNSTNVKVQPPRSKRKGMPVKRVDLVNDDADEMLTEDRSSITANHGSDVVLDDERELMAGCPAAEETRSPAPTDLSGSSMPDEPTSTSAAADDMPGQVLENDIATSVQGISETVDEDISAMSVDTGDNVVSANSVHGHSPLAVEVPSPASATATEDEDVVKDQAQTETETTVYSCQYAGGCNTTWNSFAAYERHYMAAHGGRFPCTMCPQSFTSRNNRRRHIDGHAGSAGSNRHQCPTCGKRFARADISKEHRLTHTRSYRCGMCSKCGEKGGSKRSSLLLHLKRCLAFVDIENDIDESENVNTDIKAAADSLSNEPMTAVM